MFSDYLLPLLLFLPGAIIFHLLSYKLGLGLSKLETIVLGCAFWNFLLVALGYLVGVLSYSLREFFMIFTVLSLAITISAGILSGYYLVKRRARWHRIRLNNVLLFLVAVPFVILIFTLLTTHSIGTEFDPIFLYLTSAKSMVATNSLQYGFYRQTGLTTAVSPASPITYAWLMVLCQNASDFEVAVRIIPFAFILLTGVLVYLIAKEISENSMISIIGSVFFFSMPVVAAIASNYSLYLDIPFTFLLFLSVFTLLRIWSKPEPSNFWWLMLGIAVSFMLLEKDMSFFILPAFLAIILIPTFKRFKKEFQVVLALVLALLFTIGYEFFFVWDIYHSSSSTLTSIIIRQIPIFIIIPIVSLLFLLLHSDGTVVTKRTLTCFCVPFVPVVVYLLRNVLLYGAVSYSLPFFNTGWKNALATMSDAGLSQKLSANLFHNLRWDILLTGFSLGAIFLAPVILGLLGTMRNSVSKQTEGRRNFIVLSSLIALLGVWSWALNCEYQGPGLRALYYFAPLFAIFAAMGVKIILDNTNVRKSLVPRFVIFISLIFLYLWVAKFSISGSGTQQIGSWLISLKTADLETLLAAAFFFFLSFYPFNLRKHNANTKKYQDMLLRGLRLIIPLALLALSISLILPFSANMLSNYQENISHISSYWENNLYEVISYVNQNLKDNLTIMTCYAMPIAYFTNHPVIEVTTYDGVITLFSLSNIQTTNNLVAQNVHYLLFPKPGNNYYMYFQNLSREISILSPDFIYGTPSILPIKEFSKFTLYNVTTSDEIERIYSYLTTFDDGLSALNEQSQVSHHSRGVIVNSTQPQCDLVIADDNQDSFWKTARANPADEITISNDPQNKVMGNDSLRIDINGTGNMVLAHTYQNAQDWSSFNTLELYFYGVNTTKTISFTFHTKIWKDYYATSVKDDFTGWRKISIPSYSFSAYGSPLWANITYIEILLGDRNTTYYMDRISLENPNIGIKANIPPIVTDSSEVEMVVSTEGYNLSSPATITLTSPYGKLTNTLLDGINSMTIPSTLLTEGATFVIYYPQSSDGEELTIYYLGLLSS